MQKRGARREIRGTVIKGGATAVRRKVWVSQRVLILLKGTGTSEAKQKDLESAWVARYREVTLGGLENSHGDPITSLVGAS